MNLASLRKWLGIEMVELSLAERLVAASAGGLSILLLMFISTWMLPAGGAVAVAASMGASAIILFVMPHSPLAQPWSVVGGHVVAAAAGVACARWVPYHLLAGGCAVALTILLMTSLKCIHPPGGGTALGVVMGGAQVHELGWQYVLTPVLLNALVMVVLAVLINYLFPWRRYPVAAFHRAAAPSVPSPSHEEILAAVRSMDSFVDIDEEDLIQLVALLSKGKK